ncbi:5956_t:CDS:2 [Diversispora eburnea]|uniref:5956_t:CDS:1 n=1 Tax=Diversispora eburnea TaxID=1213867 RepID=A0A9N8ZTV1_9GLOM|nr:5956_t:CDS:2 [Diversispora eburnea]
MIGKTQFLVTGMLISGVANTILNKLQDIQCVANCDDPNTAEYFEQPVWQTLNMFIGETMCFIVVYIILLWDYQKEKRASYTPLEAEAIITNNDPGIVISTDSDSRDSRDSTIKINDEYLGPDEDLTGWKIFLFWIPTICDIMGTTLMNVGLIYTSASVYQMLRGAVVLFTGTFSVLFLRRRLLPYHWFSLFLVVLGVSIVGMSSVLKSTPVENGGQSQNINGTLKLNDEIDTGSTLINSSTEYISDKSDAIFGIFFVLFAQIFTAAQFVIEERIMERYRIKPMRAVGLEGIFGLITVISGMIILYFLVGTSHPGGYFDIPVGFNQIISYKQIWIAGISICFSIAFFNFFGLSVTRTISATARSTIDTSRIVFIWLVSLSLGWETFSWLQVFGFIILIYGTFIFNNVVSPPLCFTVPPPQVNEIQPLLIEDHEHI